MEANETGVIVLYEMAICEREDFNAMNNQENFLSKGGTEWEANEKSADVLFKMAIREGEGFSKMNNQINQILV